MSHGDGFPSVPHHPALNTIPLLLPIPTEQKHADYYFPPPRPKILEISHFCLSGSSIYLNFLQHRGIAGGTGRAYVALQVGDAKPISIPSIPQRAKGGKQTQSIVQEKRNKYLPLGLARPGRWLVGGRHGPRSLHPPHGEGITEPLVSHVTAARHLTVHLVAL